MRCTANTCRELASHVDAAIHDQRIKSLTASDSTTVCNKEVYWQLPIVQFDQSIKMVHYKLTYFNVRGRAELARLIFHYKGVEFEDFRFQRDEWAKYKPSK